MKENSPKFNPAVLPAEFMKRFEHTDAKEPRHFLYPGQVFVSCDPITISTILGSCRRLPLGPAQEGGRDESLSAA